MRPSGFAAFKDTEGGYGSSCSSGADGNNAAPHSGGGTTAGGNVQMGGFAQRDLYDYGDDGYDDSSDVHRRPDGTDYGRHNLY